MFANLPIRVPLMYLAFPTLSSLVRYAWVKKSLPL